MSSLDDLDFRSPSRSFSLSFFRSRLFSSTSTKGSFFFLVSSSVGCSSLTSISVAVLSPSRAARFRGLIRGGRPRPLPLVPPSSFPGGGTSRVPVLPGASTPEFSGALAPVPGGSTSRAAPGVAPAPPAATTGGPPAPNLCCAPSACSRMRV